MAETTSPARTRRRALLGRVGPVGPLSQFLCPLQGEDRMKMHRFAALGLVCALVVAGAHAEPAAAVKSGPQAGEELAGPFHPLNINGKQAGKKHCLYCENGNAPVAMIFAREPSANLTALLKKIDAACLK